MGALTARGALAEMLPAAGKGKRSPWDRYFLGASYYPEWWDPSEWETDFRQMHELGLNTVRMGEFAWALFEPALGQFEFSWMDRAIAVANRYGIDVVLATPTASVPPWLYQLHPDVLGANEVSPYTGGGRKGYCVNSPDYLEASARITAALGKHYGHHPGVIGWQLDNEPGSPFGCYDHNCERAFQLWLQKRYGTLGALNRSWNGAFWSNEYSAWSQIHFPTNSAEGGWQPAITLDYRRFFSDSYLNQLRRQAAILRENTENQFIFTNWPAVTWSVDVFAGAEFLDAAAWDNYNSAPGLNEFQRQYGSGFNHDLCRCAGPRQRFICAEQNAYVPANALDEGLRLQAYMDLAHGSHGQLFFEWRRPLAGGEQFRPSFIKRFDGTINPAKPVFSQLGKEFARLGPRLAGATTRADIALLYDYVNEFAQGFWTVGEKDRHYDSEAVRYYRGFKVLQRNIDVVPPSADFSPYKVIVAPSLRLVDDATAERLRAFVSSGGILVLNYRAGTQNTNSSMRRVLPPGAFAEIAGVTAESNLDLVEYGPGTLDERLRSELGIGFSGNQAIFHPRTMLESLALHGAEPIATYRGGRMAGRPAITRNRHGQGWVFYVGTDCAQDGFHEALARAVGTTGRLSPLLSAPYGVEVASREDAGATYYFLLNLTETAHNDIPLPTAMEDLLSLRSGVTKVSLGALQVAVLAAAKEGKTSREG
jgi:beta-galactosidase